MSSPPLATMGKDAVEAAAAEEDNFHLFDKSQLYVEDFVVIVVYFLSVLTVGIWSSWRSRRKASENNDEVGGYFLASRNMDFYLVGASLFASNIGSEHFIGLAGSGAAAGIAVASYEVNAIFILHLLGWLFVPVYLVSGVYTMPEYMRTRFGGNRIRILLSVLALVAYVFTKISADLYAGALFIKLSFGLSGLSGLYVSILILLALAAFFTIFGGLSAVIWTDFIQAILMILGALYLMFKTFAEVGSLPVIFDKYSKAVAEDEYQSFDANNQPCGLPREDFGHFFRDAATGDIPWTGVFTGMIINSIWYWCTDQVIVQRTLASKNITHAKGGCVFAAYCKLLPFFMLVIPGMAARVLWPNLIACSSEEKCEDICGSKAGCSNISYVLLVLKLLPTGLRGMMLAVMLAALMSSLTSIFNSASTIFTMDIWKLWRKEASDLELIVVGRFTVIVLVVVSVLWIPVILSFKNPQLFLYIQAISSYLAPPMTAVFLMAMLWHRMTEPGAFWGLLFGFGIGVIRFILEFGFHEPACGSPDADTRPEWIKQAVGGINFLHFSPISFVLTAVVAFAVSMLDKPIREQQLYRLTFWTRFCVDEREPIDNDEGSRENEPIVKQENQEPGYLKVLYALCCMKRSKKEEEEAKRKSPKLDQMEINKRAVAVIQEEKALKKCTVVFLVVISVLWIPVILAFKNPQLFFYIQAIQSYLAPPTATVFLMAVLWHGTTEPGAFWGLAFGFGLAAVRFILEFGFLEPPCGAPYEDPRPDWMKILVGDFNFLHFAAVSFVLSGAVAFFVSLATDKIKENQLLRLTFWSRFSLEEREAIDSNEEKVDDQEKGSEKDSRALEMLYTLCCMKNKSNGSADISKAPSDQDPTVAIEAAVGTIKDDPVAIRYVNASAFVVLCAACFIWGYYA